MPYADPEKRREYGAENLIKWRLANPDKVQLQRRRNYLKNREKRIAQSKAYAETHKPQIRERNRKYRAAQPDRYKDVQLRSKYGLTIDQYKRACERRGGCCDLCGFNDRPLHVDHNHETGVVRGLLCSPCNTALGRFENRIKKIGLQKFVDYSQKEEVLSFSLLDAVEDIPVLLTLVQQVEAGIQALPKPAKASDYTKLAATVLPSIGALIDEVQAQIAAGTPPPTTAPASPTK